MMTKSVIDFKYVFYAMAISFASVPVYIIAPQLYNLEFNLNFKDVTYAILIAKTYDIVQAPFLGYFLDKYFYQIKQKIKLNQYLLIPAILSFCALLFPPEISREKLVIWLAVILITNFSIINILAVNYYAIIRYYPVLLHDRMITIRELFFFVGLLAGLILSANFHLKFYVVIVFVLLISFGTYLINKIKILNRTESRPPKISWSDVGNFISKYKIFLLFHFFNVISFASTSSLIFIFISNFLKLSNYSAFFILVYSSAILLGFYLCFKLIKRFGNFYIFVTFASINILIFSQTYFLFPGAWKYFSIICFFAGIFQAADFIVPINIYNNFVINTKSPAIFYSVWLIIIKISLAIGSILAFWLLSYLPKINFSEENSLLTAYVIIPCIIKFSGLLFFVLFFQISKIND